jgi:hypothetical protein
MLELAGCAAVAGTEGPAINPRQQQLLLYSNNCGRRVGASKASKTFQDNSRQPKIN